MADPITLSGDDQFALKTGLQDAITGVDDLSTNLARFQGRMQDELNALRAKLLELNTLAKLPDWSAFEPSPEPPPAPPTPAVTSQFGEVPPAVADAIAKTWPEELWSHAADVSHLESGWNPTAVADTTEGGAKPCGTLLEVRNGVKVVAERSVGLFMYNECAHGPLVGWDDPILNATRAYELYKAAGNSFAPWYFSAKKLGLT